MALSPLLDATLAIEGPLGRYFADRLGLALEASGLHEVSREDLGRAQSEQQLHTSGAFDERTAAQLGRLVGADALLLGRYYPTADGVEIHLRWVQVAEATTRRTVLKLKTGDMPRLTPPDNAAQARNWHTALSSSTAQDEAPADGLRVEVWPERGPGSTYKVGEALVVKLRATADCYLRLYHLSVEGAITQLFPNRYQSDDRLRGGQVVTLGEAGAPYKLTVSPPAGVEYLKAVVSAAPFQDEPLAGASFRELGRAGAMDLRGLRTRGIKLEAATAEALAAVEVE